MEYGLHYEVVTDFEDIGDRILQWVYQRDKLRTEIKQNFPRNSNPTVSSAGTSAATINQRPTTKSPTLKSNKVVETGQSSIPAPINASTTITHELCYVCGKCHPPGCVLQAHADANNNPGIAWKDSPTSKAITKIKT